MPEAFLLKGTPTNLSWSLIDMKNKKTPLLRDKPDNWMIWGVNHGSPNSSKTARYSSTLPGPRPHLAD